MVLVRVGRKIWYSFLAVLAVVFLYFIAGSAVQFAFGIGRFPTEVVYGVLAAMAVAAVIGWRAAPPIQGLDRTHVVRREADRHPD